MWPEQLALIAELEPLSARCCRQSVTCDMLGKHEVS